MIKNKDQLKKVAQGMFKEKDCIGFMEGDNFLNKQPITEAEGESSKSEKSRKVNSNDDAKTMLKSAIDYISAKTDSPNMFTNYVINPITSAISKTKNSDRIADLFITKLRKLKTSKDDKEAITEAEGSVSKDDLVNAIIDLGFFDTMENEINETIQAVYQKFANKEVNKLTVKKIIKDLVNEALDNID